jgi:hypothetical protein
VGVTSKVAINGSVAHFHFPLKLSTCLQLAGISSAAARNREPRARPSRVVSRQQCFKNKTSSLKKGRHLFIRLAVIKKRPPCRRLSAKCQSSYVNFARCFRSNHESAVAGLSRYSNPLGKDVILGHKLRQILPDGGMRWYWPVRRDHTGNAYIVQHEDYSEYPHAVPFNYLTIELGVVARLGVPLFPSGAFF